MNSSVLFYRATELMESLEIHIGCLETIAEENDTYAMISYLATNEFEIDVSIYRISDEYSHMSITLVNEDGDVITLRTIDNVVECVCDDEIIHFDYFSDTLSANLDIIGRMYWDFINR